MSIRDLYSGRKGAPPSPNHSHKIKHEVDFGKSPSSQKTTSESVNHNIHPKPLVCKKFYFRSLRDFLNNLYDCE